jgi:DNA-binding transcriptional LysR family regulator
MNFRHLSGFELRQICYFMEIVNPKGVKAEDKYSFVKAAERLQIEQAPLSQRIQALEKSLKVKLFDRTKRPIRLTAAGKAFADEAEVALMHLERAIAQAQRASRGEIGQLTIGINTSISNSLLPKILQQFSQQFPDAKLNLEELLVGESYRKLQNNEIDADFQNLYNLQDLNQDYLLQHEVILREPLVLVVPEAHPLARKAQVYLQDLDEQSFVLPAPNSVPALHGLICGACESAGVRLRVAQEATWMSTVLSLVAGGVGVTLLPANAMNLRRSGVAYRTIAGQTPLFQLALVWRRDNTSELLHNFLTIVRQVASDQGMNQATG